jgi:hypothetical protein
LWGTECSHINYEFRGPSPELEKGGMMLTEVLPRGSSGSLSLRAVRSLLVLTTAVAALAILGSAPAQAASGSVKTTDSACVVVNENVHYAEKTDVFIDADNFDPDTFLYFKVESPGGALLGVPGAGPSTVKTDSNGDLVPCVSLWDNVVKQSDGTQGYDDTTNNGIEYKVSVSTDPTFPDAKTDNFKVDVEGPPAPPAADLTVSKDATPAFNRAFTWGIAKDVDKTLVQQIGGSATFNYTVTTTHDSGTDSGWKATGTITVVNPNTGDVTGVDVTDAVDNGGTCTVTNGTNQTVEGLKSLQRSYTCTYSSLPDSGTNTATATWPAQDLSDPAHLDASSATGTAGVDFTGTDPSLTDECATFSDTVQGTLGTKCNTDPSPDTFKYSRNIAVPANGCQSYDNTASFTTNDTAATGSASKTVNVCGPARTGALTMGFWKGPNGNSLIDKFCAPSAGTSLATFLSGLGAGAGPFTDATGKSCSQLVTYVNTILGAASATDMNKMLKAQMLATALDVYFSGPGYSTVASGSGKNQVKPPSNFLPNGGIGGFVMDLKAICPMVDNTTAGTATCKSNMPSTNAFASGAVPWASSSVSGILGFAATVGTSPWTTGAFTGTAASSNWYGIDRTKQEILKNVFDQINNQLAFQAL